MNIKDFVLDVPCAYCGATTGNPCRTKSGQWADPEHGARWWVVQRIWMDGFEEGQRDILGALDSGYERYVESARRRFKSEAQR